MKKTAKLLLFIAIVMMASKCDAQVMSDTPVYQGVFHYSPKVKEIIRENDSVGIHLDSVIFSSDEISDIFSSKDVTIIIRNVFMLQNVNKNTLQKNLGIIMIDEYGRKVFISPKALDYSNYLLLEGGEIKDGIFFPNIIGTSGLSYKEDEKKDNTFVPVINIINLGP